LFIEGIQCIQDTQNYFVKEVLKFVKGVKKAPVKTEAVRRV